MTHDYRQVCACGHAKATHYVDSAGPGDCLGTACDCKRYTLPKEKDVARERYRNPE